MTFLQERAEEMERKPEFEWVFWWGGKVDGWYALNAVDVFHKYGIRLDVCDLGAKTKDMEARAVALRALQTNPPGHEPGR